MLPGSPGAPEWPSQRLTQSYERILIQPYDRNRLFRGTRVHEPRRRKVFARDGNLYVLSRSNAGNKNVRISVVTLDSEFLFEFANWGDKPGKATQPTSFAFGPDDRVYLADEFINTVTVFEKDGTFVGRWGEQGDGPGQFNRPSGIAVDSDGNLRVVDHLNARIQKYSPDGHYISSFGTFGTGHAEFNFPWGISIDPEDGIWIADWRNDRIQRFGPDGEFVAAFGSRGDGDGEFNRRPVSMPDWTG